MSARLHSRSVIAGAAIWAGAVVALACGPDFPPSILNHPGDYLETMPEANFAVEIRALLLGDLGTNGPGRDAGGVRGSLDDPWLNTVRADVADLEVALRAVPLASAEVQARLAAYRAFRIRAGGYAAMLARESYVPAGPVTDAPGSDLEPPAGLPREFAYYARGVVAYRFGRVSSARDWWRALLDLPAAERRCKATWAAYMLGWTQPADQAPAAAAWYRLVREFADGGYRDTLNLAADSLGWDAQLALRAGAFERAAELYLAQYAAGDGGALASLQVVARRVFEAGPDRLEAAARDERLQRVLTAYLVSRGSPWCEAASAEEAAFWLAVLEQQGRRQVAGTDRLAWLAYQEGDFDATARWLGVAPTNSLTARWLSAKLSLRQGDAARAQALLEGVVRGLDAGGALPSFVVAEEETGLPAGGQAAGELATLLMGGGHYAGALDLLLRHGWWTDAAYVGEHVLTTAELQAYVDRAWPIQPPDADDAGWWSRPDFTKPEAAAYAIRYLLARRLAREGRIPEATGYYPLRWRGWLAQYADCLARGRDARRPVAERATRLWRAARLMRHRGMELFGTETDPDWHAWAGYYDLGVFGEPRAETNGPALVAVGPDEVQRMQRHAVSPDKRFHYRYRAADLAWDAAALMPDEAGVTALVLCEAGSWLKNRDPVAADRFYKALVRRCGTTGLGQAADRLRWFPPVALPGVLSEE